jgi:hypothetical protein
VNATHLSVTINVGQKIDRVTPRGVGHACYSRTGSIRQCERLTCPNLRTGQTTTSGLLAASLVERPPPWLWESGNPAPFAGSPSGVGKSLCRLFHAAAFPQPSSLTISRASSCGVTCFDSTQPELRNVGRPHDGLQERSKQPAGA